MRKREARPYDASFSEFESDAAPIGEHTKRITLDASGAKVWADGNRVWDAREIAIEIPAVPMPVKELRDFLSAHTPDDSEESVNELLEAMLDAWDDWDTRHALLRLVKR